MHRKGGRKLLLNVVLWSFRFAAFLITHGQLPMGWLNVDREDYSQPEKDLEATPLAETCHGS